MIRNEREILNVVTSKAPKVVTRPAGGLGCCKRPSGERGGAPEKKIVNKMKKKYNMPVDHQVSRPAKVLDLRAIFR